MPKVQVVYMRTDVEVVRTTYRVVTEVDTEDLDAFLAQANEWQEGALEQLQDDSYVIEFLQTDQEVVDTEEVGKPQGPVERFITASP